MPQQVETATYTVEQAAKILGVGRDTVYRLIAEGGLPVPVLKVRHSIRIPRGAFDAYVRGESA